MNSISYQTHSFYEQRKESLAAATASVLAFSSGIVLLGFVLAIASVERVTIKYVEPGKSK